jgi:hypothetical protein
LEDKSSKSKVKTTATDVIRKNRNVEAEIKKLKEEVVTPTAIAVLHTWFTDPIYLFGNANLNRAGYGAKVFVHPTPEEYHNQNLGANPQEGSGTEPPNYLLFSYLIDNNQRAPGIVTDNVCVNKVKFNDGSILPYDGVEQKKYSKKDLLKYFLSGFPSDYVMSVRIDFDIANWDEGQLPKLTSQQTLGELVLRVVTEQDALQALNIEHFDLVGCCGCSPGAACFKSRLLTEAVQNNFHGTTQEKQIDAPKVTRPFMALFGGIIPKQNFF